MRLGSALPRTYGTVLVLVVVTFLVSSSSGADRQPFGVLLQVATGWFALVTAQVPRATRATAAVVLVAVAVAGVVGTVTSTPTVILVASALMYVIAPIAILKHLVVRRQIDVETLLGAVASYLMIGMLFAFCYQLVATLQSEPFFTAATGEPTTPEVLFFSFTTLTTTGYGNLVPAGNPGQVMAVSEMLLGQLFLVTVIAKAVTGLVPRSRREEAEEDSPPGL